MRDGGRDLGIRTGRRRRHGGQIEPAGRGQHQTRVEAEGLAAIWCRRRGRRRPRAGCPQLASGRKGCEGGGTDGRENGTRLLWRRTGRMKGLKREKPVLAARLPTTKPQAAKPGPPPLFQGESLSAPTAATTQKQAPPPPSASTAYDDSSRAYQRLLPVPPLPTHECKPASPQTRRPPQISPRYGSNSLPAAATTDASADIASSCTAGPLDPSTAPSPETSWERYGRISGPWWRRQRGREGLQRGQQGSDPLVSAGKATPQERCC